MHLGLAFQQVLANELRLCILFLFGRRLCGQIKRVLVGRASAGTILRVGMTVYSLATLLRSDNHF